MENHNNQIVSTGEWVVTLLVTAIPLIGFIMLFVWAFGNNTISSKANWAKATLIWMAISIAIYILSVIIFGAALYNAFRY